MDNKIDKNDQILEEYRAEVNDTEMFILIHQGVLEGHRRQKTFNYATKMASFDEQKRDIETVMLELESISKTQQKAKYQEVQVKLLESYRSYINTLTEEKLAVNKEINKFHMN